MRRLSLVAASGAALHRSVRASSLSRPLLLRSTGSRHAGSVVVAHGPSCSAACGIFPDQGSNPCPLHQQADSQPLHHQGSPNVYFFQADFGPFGLLSQKTIDWVAYKKQKLISYSSGGWEVQNQGTPPPRPDSMSHESPIPNSDSCLFIVSSHGRRGKGALWGLFYKGTNHTYEGSSFMS